jgi:NCS1 family nucleobase:cation symporter-1
MSLRKSTANGTDNAHASSGYTSQVFQVEPYGVQPIADANRHGSARSQFTLWFGSNLTIADYALGFLPISLGLPFGWTLAALLVGNMLGSLVVALAATMGPTYGLPQLMIGRFAFGRRGGYLPAALNYLSTAGWFAVNNILGTFGLQILFPHLPFYAGSLLLVILQALLAIYGHNLIHTYERAMSVILGILFVFISVLVVQHGTSLSAYHPTADHPWALFGIMVAAAFSYIGSWAPYASDYSRYLASSTSRRNIGLFAFIGNFLSATWLELLGLGVAILAGPHGGNSIQALHLVAGNFGGLAVVAVILGGTAADALNLYSNGLSAGALDIRLPRYALTILASIVGLALSWAGAGGFENNYENFLLLLGYWMTPWLGVLFAYAWVGRSASKGDTPPPISTVRWSGLASFFIGLAVSVPFMSSSLYEGPIAYRLNGADLTFYVGFLVAFAVMFVWTKRSVRAASNP